MLSADSIIGSIFLVLGLLLIALNKYFVAYHLYLNFLFAKMLYGSKIALKFRASYLKSKFFKYFYMVTVYITGICLIVAGWVMVRVR